MKKLLLICLIAASTISLAQQTPAPIQSPDVHTDGRVTFRFRDPNAQKVSVSLEGTAQPFAMQKDESGLWTATIGPLQPDLYGYSFTADGVHLVDPSNSEIKPNLLNLTNLLRVPGSTPLPWDDTDISHGVVHHHFYRSAIVGDNRDFYVYTPPGYDPSANVRYPVLYLLHGFSDDASGWTAVGKANLILDSLFAENKAKPMIVVMTLGYGAPEYVHRSGSATNDQKLRERNLVNFRSALIDEFIPAGERNYKAMSDRDSRAIAGLSMGGAESLFTGLNRLDKFSWVGAFSAGGLGSDLAVSFPQLAATANSQLHLLWVACGTEDRLITPNRQFIAWTKSRGINVTAVETPGMHTWMVWRRNLVAFAPLLFQPGSTNTVSSPTAAQ